MEEERAVIVLRCMLCVFRHQLDMRHTYFPQNDEIALVLWVLRDMPKAKVVLDFPLYFDDDVVGP